MASVVSLLMVDIAGLLAALSIWTASFLLLSRAAVSSSSAFITSSPLVRNHIGSSPLAGSTHLGSLSGTTPVISEATSVSPLPANSVL